MWDFPDWNLADKLQSELRTSLKPAEIQDRIRKAEKMWLKWQMGTILMCIVGALMMVLLTFFTLDTNPGLLVLIGALLLHCHNGAAYHRTLCTLTIIWDMRKHEEEAMQHLEIQDL